MAQVVVPLWFAGPSACGVIALFTQLGNELQQPEACLGEQPSTTAQTLASA